MPCGWPLRVWRVPWLEVFRTWVPRGPSRRTQDRRSVASRPAVIEATAVSWNQVSPPSEFSLVILDMPLPMERKIQRLVRIGFGTLGM